MGSGLFFILLVHISCVTASKSHAEKPPGGVELHAVPCDMNHIMCLRMEKVKRNSKFSDKTRFYLTQYPEYHFNM